MYWRIIFSTCIALLIALPIQAQNASSLTESGILIAGDVDMTDNFSHSVSLDGDRALIGAYHDDDNGIDSGSAYVFELVNGVWTETAKLTASDGTASDWFGYSVSLDGDRALIGAHQDDENGILSGSVYVFELVNGIWTQTAKLNSSESDERDFFGFSVSLEGNRALIGALEDEDNGIDSGSAYVFDLTNGIWAQTAKLNPEDGANFDAFGASVSLNGDRALIGAFKDDDNGGESGSAYIFDLTAGIWTQTAKIIANDGASSESFAFSVSLSGDRALIGTPFGDDGNGFSSGLAYVFDFTGGVWTQTEKLTASDGAQSDIFGISVSLSGNRALIGAEGDADNGFLSGSAYLFDLDGGLWTETEKLTASDGDIFDQFGRSVSLSGDRALLGAPSGVTDSGSAYVFTLPSSDSDEDGYTDDEEIACGTDPNDAASFPAGTVSGNITADGGFLAGIAVKALDADDPAIVLGTGVTDASGNYGITGVAQGDIVVMVVEPLGFSAQANDLLASVVCNTTTAGIDFTLDGLTLVNDIRTASYWKNELDIAASGGNSAEDFATIIAEIQTRFTDPYFNTTFAGADDVNDWLDIFSKRPGTLTDRAKIELAALVMNVMSMKVSQFEVVTDDGFTVADVITAAAMLLEDGDPSNDNAAKLWAEQVNRGMTIAAGQIGAGNIAYERNDEGAHQTMNVQQATKTLPESFELTGNYPNPFNPMTTIRFAMPEAAHVTLTVFNTLGQQVVQLVDSPLSAGHHELNFEAGDLPSGTYLYRLETPQGNFTKTMAFVK